MSLLRVADLQYQMHRRALHPEIFDFVASEHWSLPQYEVRLRLCRGGHVVEVIGTSGKQRETLLTEYVGPSNPLLPESGRIARHVLRGQKHLSRGLAGGVQVHAAYHLESLTAGDYEHYHPELWCDAQRSSLWIESEGASGRPETAIGFFETSSLPFGFSLHACHTFPADCAVLKTQLLVDVNDGG